MPTSIKGVKELRYALRTYDKDLMVETRANISKQLKIITFKARGYLPSESSVLSGWTKQNVGRGFYRPFPKYDAGDAKRGISYSSAPSKPNRSGFIYAATIYNKSASGAIVEVAGRRSGLGGRKAGQMTTGYKSPSDHRRIKVRNGDHNRLSASYNPNAGAQFIAGIGGQLKTIHSTKRGRIGHKKTGRLIFRAWAEDNGKVNAAVIQALEGAADKFRKKISQKKAA